jgi:hypothetical protein
MAHQIMNSEVKSTLSNNNLRRMQGWARAVYPGDWQDRCAVVAEYLAQLVEDKGAALIKKGWPEVFATAEREWPEAFAGWHHSPAEQSE